MKEIFLTRGLFAQVDDGDYDYLNTFSWYAATHKNLIYAVRALPKVKGTCKKHESMHRVIMIPPNNLEIDHIDGNGLNNQKSNLRIVTTIQNQQNKHLKTKSSKFLGVSKIKNTTGKIWKSKICVNGEYRYLGCFKTEEEAHKRYLGVMLK